MGLPRINVFSKVSSPQNLIYNYLTSSSDNRPHVSWRCYELCLQLLLLQVEWPDWAKLKLSFKITHPYYLISPTEHQNHWLLFTVASETELSVRQLIRGPVQVCLVFNVIFCNKTCFLQWVKCGGGVRGRNWLLIPCLLLPSFSLASSVVLTAEHALVKVVKPLRCSLGSQRPSCCGM